MRRLPDQPTAEEVRVYAGLTEREWDVFTVRLPSCPLAL